MSIMLRAVAITLTSQQELLQLGIFSNLGGQGCPRHSLDMQAIKLKLKHRKYADDGVKMLGAAWKKESFLEQRSTLGDSAPLTACPECPLQELPKQIRSHLLIDGESKINIYLYNKDGYMLDVGIVEIYKRLTDNGGIRALGIKCTQPRWDTGTQVGFDQNVAFEWVMQQIQRNIPAAHFFSFAKVQDSKKKKSSGCKLSRSSFMSSFPKMR